MKKFVGIAICLLLLVVAVVPTVALASSTTAEADIIYFLNPTAIAVVDDYLFVADNIEEGKSVILAFDVGGTTPEYKYTYEVEGNVTNLSAKNDTALYAVMPHLVVEYALTANKQLEVAKTFTVDNAIAVDFTYGIANKAGTTYTEYVLTSEHLRKNDDGTFDNITTTAINNTKACLPLDNYIYYLYQEKGLTVCKRYNGNNVPDDDIFNTANGLGNHGSLGLFSWKGNLALFNETNVLYVIVNEVSCDTVNLIDEYDTATNGNICDVVANDSKLFVLNGNHKVEIYTYQDGSFSAPKVIGSEMLNRSVPKVGDFTTYTLVRSKGYPTNIIFKTTDEATSVENLVEGVTDEYIVLGYNNEDPNFYYVLYGDKFGWVRRSDGATTVQDDGNLEEISTAPSAEKASYDAFIPGMVPVYILPRESFATTPHQESPTNRITVKVLQHFTEKKTDKTIEWYLVEYNGSRGFVKDEYLTKLPAKSGGSTTVSYQRQINASLVEAVTVYTDRELTTEYLLDGETVKLRSGTIVTLVGMDGDWALIQFENSQNGYDYGYIQSNRLIGEHAVTTTTTVGFVLLAIALALAIGLVIYVTKSQKKTAPKQPRAKEKVEDTDSK